MAYRIPLTDSRLIAREEQAIADLQELYPDGRVTTLDARDRALGKRLSKLYVAIGYETRVAMLEAWGFEVELSKGGRKATLDHEAVLAELAHRYEGHEKPQKLGILIHDNPDLASNLKSISSKSNELFGQTLARELADRGILMREKSTGDVTDNELRAMIDTLEARYRDDDNKLSTVAALKAAHPEYKIEFAALVGKSELVFGMGQRELLVERGILRANRTRRAARATDCTDEEVWEAIDQLGAMLSERPDEEKPKTVAELAKSYPEQGPYISEGKARGLTDKGPLQELGILQRTTALVKRAGVRRTPPEQMGQLYVQAGGVPLIEPDGSDTALLPRGVCGLDVEHGLEMRELLAGMRAGDAVATLAVGDILHPVLEERSEEWNPDRKYQALFLEDAEGRLCPAYAHDRRIYEDAVGQSDSTLAKYAEGKVLSVQADETAPVVLVRLRVLASLRTSTLAHALRAMGYIDERDVRGSMAWRYRIWHANHTGDKLEVMPSKTLKDGRLPASSQTASDGSSVVPFESSKEAPEIAAPPAERDALVSRLAPTHESTSYETTKTDDNPEGEETALEQTARLLDAYGSGGTVLTDQSDANSAGSSEGDATRAARTFVDPSFTFGFCEKPGQRYREMVELNQQLAQEAEQKRNEEAKRKAEEEKAARLAQIEAARKAEAETKQRMQDARVELNSAKGQFDSLIHEKVKLEAQVQEFDHQIGDMRATARDLKRIETDLDAARKELDSLGFFAFGKKNELRKKIQQLEQSQKELSEKLPSDVDESIKRIARQRDDVASELDEVEKKLAECRKRIDASASILVQPLAEKLAGASKGDVLEFGSYPQSSDRAGGEPVKWQVLEKRGDRLLLMSTLVLDYHVFNESKAAGNDYQTSELRKWMIGGFRTRAFGIDEQLLLDGDPFIMGLKDFTHYFTSKASRMCSQTEYAKGRGRSKEGRAFYWLSTPGDWDEGLVYYVNPHGDILGSGKTIYSQGMSFGAIGLDVNYDSGVRPAVWVKTKV